MDCPVRKGALHAKNTMVSPISSGVAARLTGNAPGKVPSDPRLGPQGEEELGGY